MSGLTPSERHELLVLRESSARLKFDYVSQIREAERRGWLRGCRAVASGEYDESGRLVSARGSVAAPVIPIPRSWVQLARRVERSGLTRYLGELSPAMELALLVLEEARRGAAAGEP